MSAPISQQPTVASTECPRQWISKGPVCRVLVAIMIHCLGPPDQGLAVHSPKVLSRDKINACFFSGYPSRKGIQRLHHLSLPWTTLTALGRPRLDQVCFTIQCLPLPSLASSLFPAQRLKSVIFANKIELSDLISKSSGDVIGNGIFKIDSIVKILTLRRD